MMLEPVLSVMTHVPVPLERKDIDLPEKDSVISSPERCSINSLTRDALGPLKERMAVFDTGLSTYIKDRARFADAIKHASSSM